MKKELYIIILSAFSLIYSCDKMDDPLNKYLDEGEIIYAAKVDSGIANSGYERALIKFYTSKQRIEAVKLFWNDYADSVNIPTQDAATEYSQLIENLEEKSYIFQLVSIDSYGNESLPVEISGETYGGTYESELIGRSAEVVSCISSVLLSFNTAPDDNVATYVSYTNAEGVSATVSVLSTEDEIYITDSKSDSEYYIYSCFCPENGIDTLYTENDTISGPYLFSTDDWEIVDYYNQYNSANGVVNILDGSSETRWHTASGSTYPYYVTIDLGTERTIAQFGVMGTSVDEDDGVDERTPIRVQFLVSDDNTNWTDLGEFELDNHTVNEQIISISSIPVARYFKFIGLEGDGSSNYMTLGAINAYGY